MVFTPSKYLGKEVGNRNVVQPYREADFIEEARKVLEDARKKAADVERIAYEKGFQKGEQAGKQFGIQQIEPYLYQFRRLTDEIARAREKLLAQMEPQIIRMALAIAKKVVKRVVEEDERTAIRLAKDAIGQIVDRQKLIIHVSTSDYELINELRPEFLAIEGIKDCAIELDPNVEPGGCIIETEGGTVDARICTALDAVSKLAEEEGLD